MSSSRQLLHRIAAVLEVKINLESETLRSLARLLFAIWRINIPHPKCYKKKRTFTIQWGPIMNTAMDRLFKARRATRMINRSTPITTKSNFQNCATRLHLYRLSMRIRRNRYLYPPEIATTCAQSLLTKCWNHTSRSGKPVRSNYLNTLLTYVDS